MIIFGFFVTKTIGDRDFHPGSFSTLLHPSEIVDTLANTSVFRWINSGKWDCGPPFPSSDHGASCTRLASCFDPRKEFDHHGEE